MKMRASLLKFSSVLGLAVFMASWALISAHRNLTKYAVTEPSNLSAAQVTRIGAQYGRLPLSFEPNQGQTAPEVDFLSQGNGYELFLTHQDAVLALRQPMAIHTSRLNRTSYLREMRKARQAAKTSVVRLHFEGSNANAELTGVNRLPGRTDYFTGKDSRKWRTGVPSFAQVAYRGIYPGIDAKFYGNQTQLEYDFVVSPGADPNEIALDVEGAKGLRIDADGNLVMRINGGNLRLLKPTVYQEAAGNRREIAANYAIGSDNRVKFSVGTYDSNEPLVIDPVLDYSTYLGGSAGNSALGVFDFGYGIAVDAKGDAYVAGQTVSLTFPTTASGYTPGPLASNPNGAVFVTELNPTGTAELYSTYLIGTDAQGDYGFALALDPSGNVYVTGQTFSTGFPVTANAAEGTAPANVTINGTAFLSKINPSLSGANSLLYSSYLGGTGGEWGNSVAADATNNAYIAGFTTSTDFLSTVTTATGYQTSNPEPTPTNGTAFLAVVNTAGSGASSVVYSTYLGGNGTNAANLGYGDQAFGVAADSSQNAYVVGGTSSTNFPTLNGLQGSVNASNTVGEGFVSRFNTAKTGASSLVYSTYLGGEVFDVATGAALEPGNATPANAVYVTGQTASTQFPVSQGAYASTVNANGIVFATILDTTQSGNASLKYSAVVGGSGGDLGNGIRADSSGNGYVVGSTQSANFPVTPGAFQTSNNNKTGTTALVFEVNPGGNGNADLVYSSYFGGSGPGADRGWAIALDSSNDVYITGETGSTSNFAVFPAGAFQTTMTQFDASATDAAFVAELTLEPTMSFSATTLAFGNEAAGSTATACGALNPCEVTLVNNTSAAIPITVGAITPVGTGFAAGVPSCGASVVPGTACTIAVTFTPPANGPDVGTLPISFTAGNNLVASTQNITLTGTGASFTVAPNPLPSFGFELVTTTSAAQQVILTNNSASALAFTTAATAPFAENDNCMGSVAANSMCTLNVTFAPTVTGAANGTLTVTSGAVNEVAQLSGSGGDFSVALPASISVTNNAGSGTANLTATTGFAPSVSFVCTTTIPNGSCSAATTTAPNSVNIMVSVSASVPPASRRFDTWRMLRPMAPVAAVVLALLSLPLARRRRIWLGFATLVLMVAVLSSCTGNLTGAKTYALSLMASSSTDGNGSTVSHSYSTSVTVTK